MSAKEFLRKNLSPNIFLKLVNFKNSFFPTKDFLEKKEYISKGACFYKKFLDSNSLVFDIGANYGNRVEMFLMTGAKVVAVEPQKKCCRYLKSLYRNKINIVQKGVGEKEETKDFYVSGSASLSSFAADWLKREGRFVNEEVESIEKIELTTIGKLIDTYGIPDFIKIDVEGYELYVLRGLNKKVKLISFEYAVPDTSSSIERCLSDIERLGSAEVNYSIGESMVLSLDKWVDADEFLLICNTPEFLSTLAGDIYVRFK
jgi:FkbM family methyltransferase